MIVTTVDLPCMYNNSNAGLVASSILVRSRLSSESSRQRGLGHVKGMRHIVNTNWWAEKLMWAENRGDEKQVIDLEWP